MSVPLLDGALAVLPPPAADLSTALRPIDGAATVIVHRTAAIVHRTVARGWWLLRCHPVRGNSPVPPGRRTRTNLDDATGATR
jgi:hypothetical protein